MPFDIGRRELLLGTGSVALALGSVSASFAQPNMSKTANRPDKPNVIVIVLDTLRRDHVGIYGNRRIHTPALDQLGRESLRLTHAVPEAMPTIPARRSIHSGMRTFPFHNWETRSGNTSSVWGWQHIPDEQPTLAEQMQAEGYTTLLVSDVPHQFKASMNFSRGFRSIQWIRGQEGDDYQPYWVAPDRDLERFMYRGAGGEELTTKMGNARLAEELRQYLANTIDRSREEDHFAPRVFRAAAQVLENVPRDRPFFLTVDSFDPHEPWDAPDRYVKLYDDSDYDGPDPVTPTYGDSAYLTRQQLQRMRALYAAEVTMTDRWVGFFLDQIEAMGLLDSTMIILTSDHGMALGEHGAVGKPAFALWGEMTDVPFFIRHPNGLGADQVSDYFGSTHDIASTVLDFAGIEPRTEKDGNSLLPLLDGNMPVQPREHFTSGLNDHLWVSDKRYTMIARNDGSEAKLYDVSNDPDQMDDIAESSPDEVKRLFDLVLDDNDGAPLPNYD